MNNLLNLIVAFGVTPRDLDGAVKQSRALVRRVESTAAVVERGLTELAARAAPGSKRQAAAFAARLAAEVKAGAGLMTGKGREPR